MINNPTAVESVDRPQRRTVRAQANLEAAKRRMLRTEVRHHLASLPEWAELSAMDKPLRAAVHYSRLRARRMSKRLDRAREYVVKLTADLERTQSDVQNNVTRLNQMRQRHRDLLLQTAMPIAHRLQISDQLAVVTTTRHQPTLRFGTGAAPVGGEGRGQPPR